MTWRCAGVRVAAAAGGLGIVLGLGTAADAAGVGAAGHDAVVGVGAAADAAGVGAAEGDAVGRARSAGGDGAVVGRDVAYGEIGFMSFNVCGGVCRRGEVAGTAEFAAGIAVREGVSVVLLQELCYTQFRRIRSLLATHGFTGRFAAQTHSGACSLDDPDHGSGFGVAILVRGKASGTVVRHLPTTPGFEKRLLLGTTVTLGNRSTFVAAVHLSPSPRAGLEQQLAAVAEFVNPRADRPSIVGGDFNALPENLGLARLYSPSVGGSGRFIELDETRSGNPEKGGRPTYAARKIDYVFLADRFFADQRARSVTTEFSDHRVYLGVARIADR